MTIERLQELKDMINQDYMTEDLYSGRDVISEDGEDLISLIDEKISQLSVTDEDVQEAIEWVKSVKEHSSVVLDEIKQNEPNVSPMLYEKRKKHASVLITALQQMDTESYSDAIYRLKEMFGLSVDEKVGNKTFRMVIKRKDARVIWGALQQMQKTQELEKENQGLKKTIEDMQRNLDAWNPRQSFNKPTTGNPMPQISYTTSSNKTDLADGKLR